MEGEMINKGQRIEIKSEYGDFRYGASRDASGIYRWDSNGQVPPADLLALDGRFSPEEQKAHDVARAADLRAFAAEYRAARARRTPEEIAEERFEMLAAFGPGEVVVNVLTGERTRT